MQTKNQGTRNERKERLGSLALQNSYFSLVLGLLDLRIRFSSCAIEMSFTKDNTMSKPGTSSEHFDEEDLAEQLKKTTISGSSIEEESSAEEQQEETDGEAEGDDLERTPEKENVATKSKGGMVKKNLEKDFSVQESNETTDGTWLPQHPWDEEGKARPDRINKPIKDMVGKSSVYTVKEEWMTGDKIDLEKIYARQPEFIRQMKGETCRQELERLLDGVQNVTVENRCEYVKNLKLEASSCTPHIQEIVHKETNVCSKDKGSYRPNGDKSFKAFSLRKNQQPSENNYYLDCEYMLKMHLPADSLQWFEVQEGKPIGAIKSEKSDKRWIFIPSFRRAKIALLD